MRSCSNHERPDCRESDRWCWRIQYVYWVSSNLSRDFRDSILTVAEYSTILQFARPMKNEVDISLELGCLGKWRCPRPCNWSIPFNQLSDIAMGILYEPVSKSYALSNKYFTHVLLVVVGICAPIHILYLPSISLTKVRLSFGRSSAALVGMK